MQEGTWDEYMCPQCKEGLTNDDKEWVISKVEEADFMTGSLSDDIRQWLKEEKTRGSDCIKETVDKGSKGRDGCGTSGSRWIRNQYYG